MYLDLLSLGFLGLACTRGSLRAYLPGILAILLLQALLLSSVLYAFINISRDVAKYFLYPRETDKDAKPVIIFGSGKSAAELLNAFQNDSSKNVVGIFDDSLKLKNTQISNIPIISSLISLIPIYLKFLRYCLQFLILKQREEEKLFQT